MVLLRLCGIRAVERTVSVTLRQLCTGVERSFALEAKNLLCFAKVQILLPKVASSMNQPS
jgi:hypothetical protein